MMPVLTAAAAVPVPLTAGGIAAATGGTLIAGDPARVISGVSIDTRTLAAGDVFVAIVGDRFDGHAFTGAACAAGASGVLVHDVSAAAGAAPGTVVIQAADTTRALQDLARHVRRASGTRVVAVTGSAGKTTTKELAADLLALQGDVYRSRGNYNNQIGLPLSLLDLRRGYPAAVVELGMNHAGELRVLTAIAEPDVRVWTNVAEVHAEFFASIEHIADAKAEILDGAHAGTIVVANAADPLVMARVRRCPARVVTFGVEADADVSAQDVRDAGIEGTTATVVSACGSAALALPLVGRGHLANALAAAAVGIIFGVPLDAIVASLRGAKPAARRGEVHRLAGGRVVVDDSYNSNPRALTRMLEAMAAAPSHGPRGAVLGEMLELGAATLDLHRVCGRAAAAAGLDWLVTVGGEPARALGAAAVDAGVPASCVAHAGTAAEAAELAAAEASRGGGVVLVKGSRGIRTDLVADRLIRDGRVS